MRNVSRAKPDPDPYWDHCGNILVPKHRVVELFEHYGGALKPAMSVLAQQQTPDTDVVPVVQDKWKSCTAGWSGPVHRLLDRDKIDKAINERKTPLANPEDLRRLTPVVQLLWARGEYRKLTMIPKDWRTLLDDVQSFFPNFAEVVDYLRMAFAFAEHMDQALRFDPLLLAGPPGSGKSTFAQTIAERLAAGFVCLRMETEQSNATLSGSAEYWGNSRPGRLFTWLLNEDFANPIFVLDEIDKISRVAYDPTGSLYSLLEPSTSRLFHDQSFPWIEMNASRVLWVCTANDVSKLPAPILDRVRLFNIPDLTPQQARQLAKSIFKEICAELGPNGMHLRMTRNAVDCVATLSVRQMHKVLREAVGRVLYRGARRVMLSDVVVDELPQQEERRIGFV